MTKVLVVDDSALMRRLLGQLFGEAGDFEVAFARSGVEALAALAAAPPDVITLDVEMPELDGLQCLDRIMVEHPTPVVMVSSVTTAGAEAALRALELGAVDVIGKPAGAVSLHMHEFGPELIERVRAAAGARLSKAHRLRDRVRARMGSGAARPPRRASAYRPTRAGTANPGEGLILVGSSTGGPAALDVLLSGLPEALAWPVVIAQHMPSSFTAALAKRLCAQTSLQVSEVTQPTALEPGCVYVARGDADMLISRRGGQLTALSAPADPGRRWHPSVDRLVDSALQTLGGAQMVGVLMTGMGDDGAAAMTRLRAAGGHTIAEAESSAVVWGMPGALSRLGGAAEVLDLGDIAGAVSRAVLG